MNAQLLSADERRSLLDAEVVIERGANIAAP